MQKHTWIQINSLSKLTLSISSLHSHLHLSSFQCCLLLQTLASNLHLHLQVSWNFMHLVSLVLEIKFNALIFFNNIRNTYFCIWTIYIISSTPAPIYFNIVRIKCRCITIDINNFWSYFKLLIVYRKLF